MRLFQIMFPLVLRKTYDALLREQAYTKLDLEIEKKEHDFYQSVSRSRFKQLRELGRIVGSLESNVMRLESEVKELETERLERK